jgi:bifunctional DNase/RNase
MRFLPAEVRTVTMTKVGFVILLEAEDGRILPIHIGPAEAQSILLVLNDVAVPRPLTHDLCLNMLERLAAEIDSVIIQDLRKETFFATLNLVTGPGDGIAIDCRPSDAIALALRCGAAILIAESVLDRAGFQPDDEEDADAPPENTAAGPPAEDIPPDPLQRLQAALRRAISEERYEDAAKLRDEIARLSRTTS